MLPNTEPQTTDERSAIQEELRNWAALTGQPLPYPPETIATLEMLGFVVDLADGSIEPAQELLEQRISLSEQGRAQYAALCAELTR